MDNRSNLKISEEVIAKIVSISASEVSGFANFTGGTASELRNLLNKKMSQKGIKVEISEGNEVSIETTIIIEYGYKIQEIATKLQEIVIKNVENMTGLKVSKVDVVVSGINVVEKTEKEKKEKKEK